MWDENILPQSGGGVDSYIAALDPRAVCLFDKYENYTRSQLSLAFFLGPYCMMTDNLEDAGLYLSCIFRRRSLLDQYHKPRICVSAMIPLGLICKTLGFGEASITILTHCAAKMEQTVGLQSLETLTICRLLGLAHLAL